MTRQTVSARKNFTSIELFAVIAFLAVPAAMFMPALQAAGTAAGKPDCVNRPERREGASAPAAVRDGGGAAEGFGKGSHAIKDLQPKE